MVITKLDMQIHVLKSGLIYMCNLINLCLIKSSEKNVLYLMTNLKYLSEGRKIHLFRSPKPADGLFSAILSLKDCILSAFLCQNGERSTFFAFHVNRETKAVCSNYKKKSYCAYKYNKLKLLEWNIKHQRWSYWHDKVLYIYQNIILFVNHFL